MTSDRHDGSGGRSPGDGTSAASATAAADPGPEPTAALAVPAGDVGNTGGDGRPRPGSPARSVAQHRQCELEALDRGPAESAVRGSAGALLAALLLVALLLVELALLYPGVFFRGEILTSVALGYGSQPWRGHVPDIGRPLVANPVLSDDLSMFTPWDSFRRAPGRTSRVPLWNPASSCGSPFLAANQTAVLAPTQLLRFIWPSPRARTLGLLATVIVAGLGMFVFLRVLAIDPWAALLGGVVWANSACMLVWMLYPLAETLAWFSWFAAGATGLLLRSRATRALRLMTAAGLAAMLLAGHLPTAAQCLTVAALAGATWVALDRSALRRTARLVLPFVVGVLLATPQVLPTLEYFAESRARLVRGDARGPASADQGLPPEAAWSWLVPRGFGSPQREGYRGPLNFNEATASVGLLAILLGLAAVGMKRRRAVLPLAAITAACLVAAHGVPPLPALLGSTPVLKWAPGIRWVLLAQWAASALAGLGAAALLGGERRRAIWCTAVVGAAMLVLLSRHPSIAGLESEAMRPHEARSVAFAAIELVIVASVCALLAGRRGVRPAALLALAAVSFGAFGARGFNPTLPVAAVPSSTPETTTLSRLAGRERVLPLGWVMPRNTHLLAGLSSVRGWDAVGLERMTRFAGRAGWTRLDTAESMPPGSLALTRRAAAAIVVSDHPVRSRGLVPVDSLSGPGLQAWRVDGAHPLVGWYGAAVSAGGLDEALDILEGFGALPDGVVVVEGEPGLPLPVVAPPPPLPLDYARPFAERIEIVTDRPDAGWVVVREAAAPGWRATVDGVTTSIRVADGVFLAVPVAAGPHHVVLTYRPATWVAGVGLSFLGAVLLLGLVFLDGLRTVPSRRHSRGRSSESSERRTPV